MQRTKWETEQKREKKDLLLNLSLFLVGSQTVLAQRLLFLRAHYLLHFLTLVRLAFYLTSLSAYSSPPHLLVTF